MKTVKQACFLIFLELLSFLMWNIPGRLGVGKDDYKKGGGVEKVSLWPSGYLAGEDVAFGSILRA